MDKISLIAISIHAVFWGGSLAVIIYLLVRRIRIKNKEDFEKRDN